MTELMSRTAVAQSVTASQVLASFAVAVHRHTAHPEPTARGTEEALHRSSPSGRSLRHATFDIRRCPDRHITFEALEVFSAGPLPATAERPR